ncbi:MAG: hypothetical protein Q7R45_08345 [Sulfuricaulis sp.]|nr:hypothetical protein [Sulfuricaulis sp.]
MPLTFKQLQSANDRLGARCSELENEVERLTVENWQLRGALGYEVPGNIPPSSEFKCGLCEARYLVSKNQQIGTEHGEG